MGGLDVSFWLLADIATLSELRPLCSRKRTAVIPIRVPATDVRCQGVGRVIFSAENFSAWDPSPPAEGGLVPAP